MLSMLKIYVENRPLILTNQPIHTPFQTIQWAKTDDVLPFIEQLENHNLDGIVLLSVDFNKLKKAVWDCFKVQEAAGGVVSNDHDQILAMFRRGSWDLPKGKCEKGETLEQTAVREVQEETGLKHVHLQQFLQTTYHSFRQENKQRRILKVSHWYLMKTTDTQLVPQVEEDIELLEWLSREDMLAKSPIYPNIVEVLKGVSLHV